MNGYFKNAKEYPVTNLPGKGPLLVVAPHQDDESLGCGGTIALAAKAGVDVYVIFMTDGSKSHPGSVKYPHDKLILLRENEAEQALLLLGVKAEHIYFMRMPDGSLPFPPEPDFDDRVKNIRTVLKKVKPAIIMLPWRRDPHKDHRATWEIVTAAIRSSLPGTVIWEYFVWLFERAASDDIPKQNEGDLFYFDISTTMQLKKSAVMTHISQTTDLIDDDENGFKLSQQMLDHFDNPKEYFLRTTL